MKCAVCQTENREGAKFCAKCGGAMGAAAVQADAHSTPCPACHNPCKPDAKFCPKCGHNFAAQKPAEPVIQPAAVMAPAGEALACPSCGSAVKPDAKFCLKCGYSLSKAPAQQAPVPPPATDATAPPPSFNLGMQNEVSTGTSQPVPTAQERAARSAPVAAAKKFPTLAVALGVAGLVLVVGIAAFVMHQKRQGEAGAQTNSEMPAPSASALPEAPALAAKPAVASAAPAPERAPQPAADNAAPATLPSPAPAPAAQAPLPAAPVGSKCHRAGSAKSCDHKACGVTARCGKNHDPECGQR